MNAKRNWSSAVYQFLQAILSSILLLLLPGAVLAGGPKLNQPPPPLTLIKILQAPPDASVDWEKLRGKVVVVDFWATWCGPCVDSIPHWNKLVEAFEGKPVQFIAVTDENEQLVATFLKRKPIHSWIGIDHASPSMRDRYHIQGIPTTVIVNQQGRVVAVTHPVKLEAGHIDEILDTGVSSLPAPEEDAEFTSKSQKVEPVSTNKPLFEISVRRVLYAVLESNSKTPPKLTNIQKKQVAAIQGALPESELQEFSAGDRENFALLRAELAKPDEERFQPDPDAVLAAVHEQLGLKATLVRRKLPFLVIEKSASPE